MAFSACLDGRVRPLSQQRFDHRVADAASGLERGQVGAVGADALMSEALRSGHPSGLLVVVADAPQNENASPVYAARVGEESKRLQRAGVFHTGGGELSLAFSKVADPLVGPCVVELPMPEG